MAILSVHIDGRAFASVEAAADFLEQSLNDAVDAGMVSVTREMRIALEDVYARLEKKHGRGWPTGGAPFGTSPDRLSRRTGGGLRSIRDSILVAPGDMESMGQISTGKMTIHETGGTITPKRAKYLAMPMIQALDSRGVPRKSGPRAWRNTFVARSKRGNLIIFQKRTGGKVVPLYLLKRKAVMPRRLGMAKTFEDVVPYFAAKAVRELEAALS